MHNFYQLLNSANTAMSKESNIVQNTSIYDLSNDIPVIQIGQIQKALKIKVTQNVKNLATLFFSFRLFQH